MRSDDRRLCSVGYVARVARCTRQAVRKFVALRDLEVHDRVLTGGTEQLLFRLGEVRRFLLARAERLERRAPKQRTLGSQLEFVWPVVRLKPEAWRLIKPQMLKANASLKRRLERERQDATRAKARVVDRQPKPLRSRKESRHVA
jgi:hypothetical protein